MSDLNVTAPPFAPTSAKASDPAARDAADASHPAPPRVGAPPEEKEKEKEEGAGEGEEEAALDVASVDPTLTLTVDAATRSARENCALVHALCSLLTSTRGRVAQLEARLASLQLELERTGGRRSGSSESERSWERAGADAPPTTPASPPEPSPVANGLAWADDDDDSLPPPPLAPAPAAPVAARRPPAPPPSSPRTLAPHPRSHASSPTPTAEARASFSSVVEGPRAPTHDDDDAFPKLGAARDEDGDGDVKSAPGDGDGDGDDEDERDADDVGFYDERVRGYEPAHADEGSDTIDPRNPVVNIIRLPDAFVERYLWDLPPATNFANGSDDEQSHPDLTTAVSAVSAVSVVDGDEDVRTDVREKGDLDDEGFRSVTGPSHHRRDRTRGEVFARACAALSLLCEAVGIGVPAAVKVKIRRAPVGHRSRMKFHASVRFARWHHEGIRCALANASLDDDPGGFVRVRNFYAGDYVDLRRDRDQRLRPRGPSRLKVFGFGHPTLLHHKIAEFDLGGDGFVTAADAEFAGWRADGAGGANVVHFDDVDSARHPRGHHPRTTLGGPGVLPPRPPAEPSGAPKSKSSVASTTREYFPETRRGWVETDERRDTRWRPSAKVWEGPCSTCGEPGLRVPFRPVVGGKPPRCVTCVGDEAARRRLG